MILVLRISSVLALTSASVLLVVSGIGGCDSDRRVLQTQGVPLSVEKLKEANLEWAEPSPAAVPLIVQAEAFAAYLNPPGSPGESPSPAMSHVPETPSLQPAAPPGRLRLHATSCYPDQADRSMALVSDIGSPREDQRWVKQGSQFGSFVVCEVRRGVIVYREGDHVYEATIDHGVSPPNGVAGLHPGSRRASAAILNVIRNMSVPADPNSIN